MTQLGYVGLGTMGGRMAKRLIDAGHPVVGYNRTKSKAEWLIKAGMTWADSPRQVAERSDIVLSMVTGTSAVISITDGPDGIVAGLGPGKIYIDMSTAGASNSRAVAEQVRSRGAAMLDAPVSGSVSTLEEGKLSIMVGGDRATYEKALPVLLDIGPKVMHVGANGQAVAMKIATNLCLGVQMLAFCEGVLLAEKSGIERQTAIEVMLNSVAGSPMLKYRGPFVLDMPEVAWHSVNMMQKDMLLALEMGRELDVPLPTSAVTNEFLTAARGMGLERQDFAILFKVLAEMSGVKA